MRANSSSRPASSPSSRPSLRARRRSRHDAVRSASTSSRAARCAAAVTAGSSTTVPLKSTHGGAARPSPGGRATPRVARVQAVGEREPLAGALIRRGAALLQGTGAVRHRRPRRGRRRPSDGSSGDRHRHAGAHRADPRGERGQRRRGGRRRRLRDAVRRAGRPRPGGRGTRRRTRRRRGRRPGAVGRAHRHRRRVGRRPRGADDAARPRRSGGAGGGRADVARRRHVGACTGLLAVRRADRHGDARGGPAHPSRRWPGERRRLVGRRRRAVRGGALQRRARRPGAGRRVRQRGRGAPRGRGAAPASWSSRTGPARSCCTVPTATSRPSP